jgi:hypothetical protein
MVKFIDKKEEVIQIELTSYGKRMFSQGKFMPSHYVFYDDDILYDGDYGGFVETQNNIVTRIKQTERLSVQGIYHSPDSNSVTSTNFNTLKLEKLSDPNSLFFRPLGNNSPWSDFAPAWNIKNISQNSTFTGNYRYLSNLSVPVLSCSLDNTYRSNPVEIEVGEDEPSQFKDDYILLERQELLLDVQEQNTIFKLNGNYDIEVFKVPQGGTELERLYFLNESSVDYDLLESQTDVDIFSRTLEGGDQQIESSFPKLDNSYVEYYLSLRVDLEIDDAPAMTDSLYRSDPFSGPTDPCDTVPARDTIPNT